MNVQTTKRRPVAPINDRLLPRLIAAKARHDRDCPLDPYVIGKGCTTYAGCKEDMRAIGIDERGICRHVARHTFCSWRVQRGYSYALIGKLIGGHRGHGGARLWASFARAFAEGIEHGRDAARGLADPRENEVEIGQRVYLLSGFDVEEWEVYEIRPEGQPYSGPWVRRDGRMGMHASYYPDKVHATLDEAVAASKAARERAIKRCAQEMVRLGINTNVKVRLLKPKTSRTQRTRE